MTIKELLRDLERQVAKGNGNRQIFIACDSEGNEWHKLYYSVDTNEESIKEWKKVSYGLSNENEKEIALLG